MYAVVVGVLILAAVWFFGSFLPELAGELVPWSCRCPDPPGSVTAGTAVTVWVT